MQKITDLWSMVEQTVNGPQSPQTDVHPGYLSYLLQVAAGFGVDLGVDHPGQISVAELLSPVDEWA